MVNWYILKINKGKDLVYKYNIKEVGLVRLILDKVKFKFEDSK